MCKYKLALKCSYGNSDKNLLLDLLPKNDEDILTDYFSSVSSHATRVYSDLPYSISIYDNNGDILYTELIYINNELVDRQIALRQKAGYLFSDCFGVVKIEAHIDGQSFVSENIAVMIKKGAMNQSVLNMIDYIYDHCTDYLYEEHKKSKANVGISPNQRISIDSRLSLINDIHDAYIRCFNILKYSAQTKIISVYKVDSFSKMQSVNPDTVQFVVTHPEELVPATIHSGIIANRQYYQPNKTLVKSADYSQDIYENQVIVSFLRTVITELNTMAKQVNAAKGIFSQQVEKNDYIESSYYVYIRNKKMLDDYSRTIESCIIRFHKLYGEYKKILAVSEHEIKGLPHYTCIFRNVMPYRILFSRIVSWFKCGNYDLAKSNLLLSFLSTSKIYEYFCLIKINSAFKENGFSLKRSFAFKYRETKYYKNTTYNNTFEFERGNVLATVYFQPVVYGAASCESNNISLFRNTSISLSTIDRTFVSEREPWRGDYYSPDYIVKLECNGKATYSILDAKHSTVSTIESQQLPSLIYKYLFSISPTSCNDTISGLYIFCGKESDNDYKNIYDLAKKRKIAITPRAAIIKLTGLQCTANKELTELVNDSVNEAQVTSLVAGAN